MSEADAVNLPASAAEYVARSSINWTALRIKDSAYTEQIHRFLCEPATWKLRRRMRDPLFFKHDVQIYTLMSKLPADLAGKLGFVFLRITARDGAVQRIADTN
jgi:hypothetical protein